MFGEAVEPDFNFAQGITFSKPFFQNWPQEVDMVFSLSGRGTVTLTDQAETIFTPSATGNCRYQLHGSEAWAAQMLEKIRNVNKQR